MVLRRWFVSLMLLLVFAAVGLILYDVILRGNTPITSSQPVATSTPDLIINPTTAPPVPPTAEPIISDPPAAEQLHVVQAGEQLGDIAALYAVTAESIAALNGFAADFILQDGLTLRIPAQ